MADSEDTPDAKKKEYMTVAALWVLFFILIWWIFFK